MGSQREAGKVGGQDASDEAHAGVSHEPKGFAMKSLFL
jgi:hypothetical protein